MTDKKNNRFFAAVCKIYELYWAERAKKLLAYLLLTPMLSKVNRVSEHVKTVLDYLTMHYSNINNYKNLIIIIIITTMCFRQ